MDRSRAQLIVRSLVARTRALKQSLPDGHGSRGASISPLLSYICDGVSTSAQQFGVEIAAADDEDVESYLRMLQQLLNVDASLHEYVAKYRGEINRDDLPVGLLFLVDSIVQDLLGGDFDPLIHSDYKRNYSTDSLLHDLERLISDCDGEFDSSIKPVIFNVPSLDPANAFLAPILVHEATHTYLRISNLLSEMRPAIPSRVTELAQQYTEVQKSAWPHQIFDNWMRELLCDCVALLTAGPAFPLALSALATAFDGVPRSNTHPFMRDRVAIMWSHMETLGWTEMMTREAPEVATWFQQMRWQEEGLPELEATLRAQCYELGPVLLEICRPHVNKPLLPSDFERVLPTISSLIESAIPPAEVDGEAPSSWTILLTGWIVALRSADDRSDFATVVGNDNLSKFLIKSIELAAIVDLWRSQDART